MTDQATRVVPAGWYQDPALADQVRWWNGLAWTEHVRDKPTPVVAAASTPASAEVSTAESDQSTLSTADRIAAARELERQFGISTSENEIISGATALGFGLGDATDRHTASSSSARTDTDTSTAATASSLASNPAAQRAAAERRVLHHTTTGAAWLIGLIPLFTFILGLAAAYVYFYVAAAPAVFIIAFAFPYLNGILWALGDRRALTARGFDAPNPAWSLLGGITYLIVRGRRVPGTGPLALFLVVGALVLAAMPLASASGQLKPLSAALSIQSAVSAHYLASGQAVSVNCPPFVDATVPGTLYTCDATTAIGTHRQIWVSIDDSDGRFSYSMAL